MRQATNDRAFGQLALFPPRPCLPGLIQSGLAVRTAIPGAFLPFSSGLKFSSAMTTPSRKRLMRDFKRELALGVDDRARNPSPALRALREPYYMPQACKRTRQRV